MKAGALRELGWFLGIIIIGAVMPLLSQVGMLALRLLLPDLLTPIQWEHANSFLLPRLSWSLLGSVLMLQWPFLVYAFVAANSIFLSHSVAQNAKIAKAGAIGGTIGLSLPYLFYIWYACLLKSLACLIGRTLVTRRNRRGSSFYSRRQLPGLLLGAVASLVEVSQNADTRDESGYAAKCCWHIAPWLLAAPLAHVVSDKTEAAYRRGDLFEKRRRLTEAWATFAGANTPKGQVVKFAGRNRRR